MTFIEDPPGSLRAEGKRVAKLVRDLERLKRQYAELKAELHKAADAADRNHTSYPERFPHAHHWAEGMREAAYRLGTIGMTFELMSAPAACKDE